MTAALRAARLHPKRAKLEVLVEGEACGEVLPIAETPVPVPELRGPRFWSVEDVPDKPDEVEAAQELLKKAKCKASDEDDDVEAIKTFQQRAGLDATGLLDRKTKTALTMVGLQEDDANEGEGLQAIPGETIKFKVASTVQGSFHSSR